jgi:hypothetical protein
VLCLGHIAFNTIDNARLGNVTGHIPSSSDVAPTSTVGSCIYLHTTPLIWSIPINFSNGNYYSTPTIENLSCYVTILNRLVYFVSMLENKQTILVQTHLKLPLMSRINQSPNQLAAPALQISDHDIPPHDFANTKTPPQNVGNPCSALQATCSRLGSSWTDQWETAL